MIVEHDWLRDTTIELFIESEGEALQWIIDKCGNMYHVLNNNAGVMDLKLQNCWRRWQKIVAGNGGCFYETDEETLESFKREVSAPITRAHSMENPLNIAEGKNPSLVTSLAYVIPRSRFTVTVFRNYL